MTIYSPQVSVDLFNMVYTMIAYVVLACAVWLFLRLIQACVWLPSHMKRQNDVQKMLQDKVDNYERYIKECEEKEAAGEVKEDGDERSFEDKHKERLECLNMLKNELNRIRNGSDPHNFSYLAEEEKKLLKELDEEEKKEKAADDVERFDEEELTRNDDEILLKSEPKKLK